MPVWLLDMPLSRERMSRIASARRGVPRRVTRDANEEDHRQRNFDDGDEDAMPEKIVATRRAAVVARRRGRVDGSAHASAWAERRSQRLSYSYGGEPPSRTLGLERLDGATGSLRALGRRALAPGIAPRAANRANASSLLASAERWLLRSVLPLCSTRTTTERPFTSRISVIVAHTSRWMSLPQRTTANPVTAFQYLSESDPSPRPRASPKLSARP